MALSVRTCLGLYEIVAPTGAGSPATAVIMPSVRATLPRSAAGWIESSWVTRSFIAIKFFRNSSKLCFEGLVNHAKFRDNATSAR